MPRSEAFPRAIAAAAKAVALDDSLGEAHRALAFALFYWEWNIPRAFAEYRRAIAIDPRDEEAHHWYATSLLTLHRYPEALVEINEARKLDPTSRSILSDQALIRYWNGDRAGAIAHLARDRARRAGLRLRAALSGRPGLRAEGLPHLHRPDPPGRNHHPRLAIH